jgi:SAM-dependent methyltransferase
MTSRQEFVRQLANISFEHATPELPKHLLTLFADPTIDWQDLARPVASVIRGEGGSDELLHAYLRHCVNLSFTLERRFITMRREALLHGGILPLRLMVSLAIQAFLNGYVWPESEAESRALERLGGSVRERVIGAMYRPLVDDTGLRASTQCAELLRVQVDEPAEERRLAATLDGAGPQDAVTATVRAQYEEHPYPRWLSVHRPEPRGDERARRVLVAGCGTGRDPIVAALRHPAWSFEAIDVSRRSLGYAMRKARELGVANIDFRFGDLRQVAGAYDRIVAVGVLHHLADPGEGLRALARCLAPDGELILGVYSRRGRASLEALRQLGGEGELRQRRQRMLAVLDATDPAAYEDLDFYELGHYRDTLYHVHEVELTPLELDAMIRSAGLVFERFDYLPPDIAAQYGEERDLRVWERIETERPDLFRHMFRCRLKPAIPSVR